MPVPLRAPDLARRLAKARELLTGEGGAPRAEPELWVRFSQQALALGDMANVVTACEAARIPSVRYHGVAHLSGAN